MGLRERLQSLTQFFQKAATRGHQLRENEERGGGQASSAGDQSRQRDEAHPGGPKADDRSSEQAGQQRDRERQSQSGTAKIEAKE
jgi:hypothetical protein